MTPPGLEPVTFGSEGGSQKLALAPNDCVGPGGPGDVALGRAELYSRAIGMMLQAEHFRGRLLGDEAPEWTLDTVRSVAFWNQLQCCRAQRWACFDLGRPLVALRQQVERGRLPLLEDKAGQVQFAHLSYQESRKGKGCSDQGPAETMDGQPLLGQLHAIKRPPLLGPHPSRSSRGHKHVVVLLPGWRLALHCFGVSRGLLSFAGSSFKLLS